MADCHKGEARYKRQFIAKALRQYANDIESSKTDDFPAVEEEFPTVDDELSQYYSDIIF